MRERFFFMDVKIEDSGAFYYLGKTFGITFILK